MEFHSISELLRHFEEIFLRGDRNIACKAGYCIRCLPDHFFHLVGIKDTWSMKAERAEMKSTTNGFGKYVLREKGARGKRMLAAYETFSDPDMVRFLVPKCNAKLVHIKEYANESFTVALVMERKRRKILVPGTSFTCRGEDVHRWLKGHSFYVKKQPAAKMAADSHSAGL